MLHEAVDLYGRLLHDVLFPGFEAMRGRPTLPLLRYLDRTQWATLDELHAIQSGHLRRLIRHAHRHTAWYRRAFEAAGVGPEDVRAPEDLAQVPLLERSDARDAGDDRTATAPPFAAVKKSTSGSTGRPLTFAFNWESEHWRNATRWRGYGWAGYEIGNRALHYWGFGAVPPASRWKRYKVQLDRRLKRDLYVDCGNRSPVNLRRVVDAIKGYRPEVIVAYSQAAATLARFVNEQGLRTWPDVPVLVGAERLFDHDRAQIIQAFGPGVFETYGGRETMLIGSECSVHDGLHTSMETMIVELIVRNPDGTTRAAQPGESGEVTITDLHNLAQPFIRYVNGDLAVARADGACACGRSLRRIGPVDGRVTETLRDAAGNPVNGLTFNILFASLDARQFQVVQHADRRLTLKIVPAGEITPSIRQTMLQFAGKYLPGIAVTIEVVDDIPPTAAGKHRFVVVEPAA